MSDKEASRTRRRNSSDQSGNAEQKRSVVSSDRAIAVAAISGVALVIGAVVTAPGDGLFAEMFKPGPSQPTDALPESIGTPSPNESPTTPEEPTATNTNPATESPGPDDDSTDQPPSDQKSVDTTNVIELVSGETIDYEAGPPDWGRAPGYTDGTNLTFDEDRILGSRNTLMTRVTGDATLDSCASEAYQGGEHSVREGGSFCSRLLELDGTARYWRIDVIEWSTGDDTGSSADDTLRIEITPLGSKPPTS